MLNFLMNFCHESIITYEMLQRTLIISLHNLAISPYVLFEYYKLFLISYLSKDQI